MSKFYNLLLFLFIMKKKSKLKSLLPSLKERKRYVVFEVLSEKGNFPLEDVKQAILQGEKKFLGDLTLSKAGLVFLKDWEDQKGILRVSHKEVDSIKGGLCFVRKINKADVIVRSIGVSGILKKARQLL